MDKHAIHNSEQTSADDTDVYIAELNKDLERYMAEVKEKALRLWEWREWAGEVKVKLGIKRFRRKTDRELRGRIMERVGELMED